MALQEYKQQLLENYDFEIERIVKEIKKTRAKLICLQFPEGLKPIAPEITKQIEQKTGCNVLIWLDTCFGACDTPLGLDELKVDMLIQFGHAPWSERNR